MLNIKTRMTSILGALIFGVSGLIVANAYSLDEAQTTAENTSQGEVYNAMEKVPVTILIHGGAGALSPGRYSAETEALYRAKLNEALLAGYAILENGGEALDAIEAAIIIMEDSPLFNAGKGAVFTRNGKNELDASIMDGRQLNAGSVSRVRKVKNPILLARAVMENSVHVMFSGDGAEKFAEQQGLERVKPKYFYTDNRWRSYKEGVKAEKKARKAGKKANLPVDFKFGTVGAVALDSNGNLAAGTSTGGMTLKRWGRIGDAPIIGAGTFADNRSCAVSSTGHGEFFMRLTIARDICAQVEYGNVSVEAAADNVIHERLEQLGGTGGVIVLGRDGQYTMPFNTSGMFRGAMQKGQEPFVAIYKDK